MRTWLEEGSEDEKDGEKGYKSTGSNYGPTSQAEEENEMSDPCKPKDPEAEKRDGPITTPPPPPPPPPPVDQ